MEHIRITTVTKRSEGKDLSAAFTLIADNGTIQKAYRLKSTSVRNTLTLAVEALKELRTLTSSKCCIYIETDQESIPITFSNSKLIRDVLNTKRPGKAYNYDLVKKIVKASFNHKILWRYVPQYKVYPLRTETYKLLSK